MKLCDFSFGCAAKWRCCRREVDSPWSWLVCFSATFLIALSLGIALSFGVLFPVLMDHFQESRERTAWVGSVGLALTFALGPLTSVLVNRFNCRVTAITGGLSCVVSLLLTSIAPNIAVMYLIYSLLFGFGSSCLFVSSYVITSQYFEKKRSIATGIISSGTGIGVLSVAPILQALLDFFGWRQTYRVTAGIFAGVCVMALTFDPKVTMKDKNPTKSESDVQEEQSDRPIVEQRKWLDFSVFKEKFFVVMTLSFALALLGHHIPRIHLVKFSEDLSVSADAASRLFIFIGITTFVARLLSGCLCNIRRVNPCFVYMFGLVLDGTIVAVLAQSTKYSHLVAFSVFYGLADGFVIGTFNIVLLYSVEPSKRASAFGLSALFYGATVATGPPLAGFMTDRLGTYVPSFYLASAVEFTAAILPLILVFDKTQPEREIRESVECVHDERTLNVWETSV